MKLRSSSPQTSINIKALTRNFIQTLSKAKSINFLFWKKEKKKKNNNNNIMAKTFFGSFRLHYNWCSSRVMDVPEHVLHCYDSTDRHCDSKLSGYLQWLEERKAGETPAKELPDVYVNGNDIDKLAELFIASNHEKFRLEKQESCRRRRFEEIVIGTSTNI